jgi:hypothetical protein
VLPDQVVPPDTETPPAVVSALEPSTAPDESPPGSGALASTGLDTRRLVELAVGTVATGTAAVRAGRQRTVPQPADGEEPGAS